MIEISIVIDDNGKMQLMSNPPLPNPMMAGYLGFAQHAVYNAKPIDPTKQIVQAPANALDHLKKD